MQLKLTWLGPFLDEIVEQMFSDKQFSRQCHCRESLVQQPTFSILLFTSSAVSAHFHQQSTRYPPNKQVSLHLHAYKERLIAHSNKHL